MRKRVTVLVKDRHEGAYETVIPVWDTSETVQVPAYYIDHLQDIRETPKTRVVTAEVNVQAKNPEDLLPTEFRMTEIYGEPKPDVKYDTHAGLRDNAEGAELDERERFEYHDAPYGVTVGEVDQEDTTETPESGYNYDYEPEFPLLAVGGDYDEP